MLFLSCFCYAFIHFFTLVPETSLSPPIKLSDHSRAVLLLWIFFAICAMPVSCSLVVTRWERADLLAFLYVMFSCVFLSLSHTVSWVRCGT